MRVRETRTVGMTQMSNEGFKGVPSSSPQPESIEVMDSPTEVPTYDLEQWDFAKAAGDHAAASIRGQYQDVERLERLCANRRDFPPRELIEIMKTRGFLDRPAKIKSPFLTNPGLGMLLAEFQSYDNLDLRTPLRHSDSTTLFPLRNGHPHAASGRESSFDLVFFPVNQHLLGRFNAVLPKMVGNAKRWLRPSALLAVFVAKESEKVIADLRRRLPGSQVRPALGGHILTWEKEKLPAEPSCDPVNQVSAVETRPTDPVDDLDADLLSAIRRYLLGKGIKRCVTLHRYSKRLGLSPTSSAKLSSAMRTLSSARPEGRRRKLAAMIVASHYAQALKPRFLKLQEEFTSRCYRPAKPAEMYRTKLEVDRFCEGKGIEAWQYYLNHEIQDGNLRLLHAFPIEDRLFLGLLGVRLNRHVDPILSEVCCGCRPGWSVGRALRRLRKQLLLLEDENRPDGRADIHWAVTDVRRFFDRVPADLLGETLQAYVPGELLHGLGPVLEVHSKDGRGICQGSPIASLLGNLYLHDRLDRLLSPMKDMLVLRFLDDILIVGPNENDVERMAKEVHGLIEQAGLEWHQEKFTGVRKGTPVPYLGLLTSAEEITVSNDIAAGVLGRRSEGAACVGNGTDLVEDDGLRGLLTYYRSVMTRHAFIKHFGSLVEDRDSRLQSISSRCLSFNEPHSGSTLMDLCMQATETQMNDDDNYDHAVPGRRVVEVADTYLPGSPLLTDHKRSRLSPTGDSARRSRPTLSEASQLESAGNQNEIVMTPFPELDAQAPLRRGSVVGIYSKDLRPAIHFVRTLAVSHGGRVGIALRAFDELLHLAKDEELKGSMEAILGVARQLEKDHRREASGDEQMRPVRRFESNFVLPDDFNLIAGIGESQAPSFVDNSRCCQPDRPGLPCDVFHIYGMGQVPQHHYSRDTWVELLDQLRQGSFELLMVFCEALGAIDEKRHPAGVLQDGFRELFNAASDCERLLGWKPTIMWVNRSAYCRQAEGGAGRGPGDGLFFQDRSDLLIYVDRTAITHPRRVSPGQDPHEVHYVYDMTAKPRDMPAISFHAGYVARVDPRKRSLRGLSVGDWDEAGRNLSILGLRDEMPDEVSASGDLKARAQVLLSPEVRSAARAMISGQDPVRVPEWLRTGTKGVRPNYVPTRRGLLGLRRPGRGPDDPALASREERKRVTILGRRFGMRPTARSGAGSEAGDMLSKTLCVSVECVLGEVGRTRIKVAKLEAAIAEARSMKRTPIFILSFLEEDVDLIWMASFEARVIEEAKIIEARTTVIDLDGPIPESLHFRDSPEVVWQGISEDDLKRYIEEAK